MAFVIEDADDDDDEQQYDFQAKWNQPTKSFFGGQGNDGNDGDEYNFDFGKPAASRKKSSSPPSQWRADPSVRSSLPAGTAAGGKAGSSNANNSSVRSSAPVNIMDKAQNMLQKYANPSTAAPQRRSQNLALNFDEDDLSVGSDSEDNHRAAALGHSSKYDLSFSPMANAEWVKSHKGGFGPGNKGAKEYPTGGSHGSSRSADLPELNFSPSVRSDNTMGRGAQAGTGAQYKASSLSSEPGHRQGREGYGSRLAGPDEEDDEEEGLDVGSDAGQATSIGDDEEEEEEEEEEEGDETFEESHDQHNQSNSSSDSGSSESEVGLSRAESHHQPLHQHQLRAAANASATATATASRRRLQSDESDEDDENDYSADYHNESAASAVDDVDDDEDDAPPRKFNVMTFDALNEVAGWDTSAADATGVQDSADAAAEVEESSSSVQEVDESNSQPASRLQADVSVSVGDASYEVPVAAAVKVHPTAASKPKPVPAAAVVAQPRPAPAPVAPSSSGSGGGVMPMPSAGDGEREGASEQVAGTIAQKAALQQKQLREAEQRKGGLENAPAAAAAPAAVAPSSAALAPPTVSTSAAFAPSAHLPPPPEQSSTPQYAPVQQQPQYAPQQQPPQQPYGHPQQPMPPQGPPTVPYGYGYPPAQVNWSWQPQQQQAPPMPYGQPPPSTYGGFGASRGLYSSTTSAYDPMVMQLLHELHQAKLEAAEANNRLAEVLLQLHKNTELTRSSVASMPTSGGRSGPSSRSNSPRRRSNSDVGAGAGAGRYGKNTATGGKKGGGAEYEDDYEDVPDEAANSDDDEYADDYEDDFEESRITNASASSIVVDTDSDEDVGPRGGGHNRGKAAANAPKKVVTAMPKASSASAQAKKSPSSLRGSNGTSKAGKTNSRSPDSPAKPRSDAARRSVTIADDAIGAASSSKSLSDREYLAKLMESAAGSGTGAGGGRGLEGIAPLRSVSAAASTAEDPLGSALLASQSLFRKQLGSLRQRLQVANSCYFDAMLRSSGAGTGIGPTSAPATATGLGTGTGVGVAGSSSSAAPATASTETGAGADLRFSQSSHPAGPGGVSSLQQLMDQFSHNREAQQKQLYAQMQSGAYYSPHVSMPFQQQPPVLRRGVA